MDYEKIETLSKEKLFVLLKIYAKHCLVHNGCWFFTLENALGL